MGGFGSQNPFPFQFGGGKSKSEQVYDAYRKAPGLRPNDQPIEPQGGIADAWRWAKAKAIASALSGDERAALQAFPNFADDRLDMYETMLGLASADTLSERQATAATAWTSTLRLDIPGLLEALQRIDPRVSIDQVDNAQSVVTNFGKVFAGLPGAGLPSFGPTLSAAFPNYATSFVLLVRYTLAPGQLTILPSVRAALVAHLNEALPSWVDFALYTGTGFYLDGGVDGTSLLDQTAFS